MIKIVALKHYLESHSDQLEILNNVNLQVNKGESLAIVGNSGSGKTTLLGLMAGLDRASSGQIWLNGTDISLLDEDARADIRQQNVAFVFQNFQLLDSLTALENVALPLELKQLSDAQSLALKYLDQVGLQHRVHHYPQQLSGGEQQRVALARAFACQAPILFADEPTGNLDKSTGDKIIELMFELNREHHTTLILVTHDDKLALRCDRQLRLEDGSLKELSQTDNKPSVLHSNEG